MATTGLEWVLVLNVMVAGADGVSGAQRWFETEAECMTTQKLRVNEVLADATKHLLVAECKHLPEGFRVPDQTRQPPAHNKSQAI